MKSLGSKASVSSCNLIRLRIGFFFDQLSDEKQSGRKSYLAVHLWNSSYFRNGGGSVLGGYPPLAGNISEIRVSFRPTNFRVGEK